MCCPLSNDALSPLQRHVTQDAQWPVRMVTDLNGNVVSRFSYAAFGELLPSSFDGVPGGFFYRYVGGYGVRFDPATGLYYMRERWYDPTLARFISRDPLRKKNNRYAYAGNNPARYIDPRGLQSSEGATFQRPFGNPPTHGNPLATPPCDQAGYFECMDKCLEFWGYHVWQSTLETIEPYATYTSQAAETLTHAATTALVPASAVFNSATLDFLGVSVAPTIANAGEYGAMYTGALTTISGASRYAQVAKVAEPLVYAAAGAVVGFGFGCQISCGFDKSSYDFVR